MDHSREELLPRLLRKLTEKARLSDDELLRRFSLNQDQTAFALLVTRYGPMVRRICRGVVRDENVVDDVFQATFLVLAQKAGSLRRNDAVGPFLHGTAYRMALSAVRRNRRRRMHENNAATQARTQTEPGESELTFREVRLAVDAEVTRLPDKYRIPVILCCLEGLSHEQAAERLGIARRTLSLRVEQGRALLRQRLQRRGIELSAVLFPALLAGISDAAVAPALIESTARLAAIFVTGAQPPDAVAHLMRNASLSTRGKMWAAAGVLVALVGAAGFALMTGKGGPSTNLPNRAAAIRENSPGVIAPAGTSERITIPGRVLDEGKPVPDAHVTALVHRPLMPGEITLRDDVLGDGKTDADGVFQLSVPADYPTWCTERRVTLFVHAPKRITHTVEIPLFTPGDGKDSRSPVEVQLPKREVIKGRLLDPVGAPAPGVTLRVARLGDAVYEPMTGVGASVEPPGWPKPVVSDAEGRFQLTGVAGSDIAWLRVEDENYAPLALRLTPGRPEMTRRLERSHWMEGRAIAADTGKPLADVRVSIIAAPLQSLALYTTPNRITVNNALNTLEARTDAEGRYRIRFFRDAAYEIELHPPEGSPYLAVHRNIRKSESTSDIALPRGVALKGQFIDSATSKPIGGGSVFWDAPRELLSKTDQDALNIARADRDGRFQITVPNDGPIRLQYFGPTAEYIANQRREWKSIPETRRWKLTPPPLHVQASYCHGEVVLESTADAARNSISLPLRRGQTIEGEVYSSDGQSVSEAVLLCSGRVSPIHSSKGQALRVKQGRFMLPGCEPDRVYTVVVVDCKRGEGAVARISCSGDSKKTPRIRLEPCGEACVGIKPATTPPQLLPALYLRLPKSYPIDDPPLGLTPADLVEDFAIDPNLDADRRVLSKDGLMTLPCLVPGAKYVLVWRMRKNPADAFHARIFDVLPGEKKRIADLELNRN
jgi:RNA polymerase sigma factor (sigma-70 family)